MRTPWKRNLVLVMLASLLAGCENVLKPEPFLLRCQLEGGSSKTVRVIPRKDEVQELDPRTLDRINTFKPDPNPDPDTAGLVDEITVSISPQEVRWEVKQHRPQMEWESHSVDLEHLTYTREIGSFTDLELSSMTMKGTCQRMEERQSASTSG
ncbi:MAG: hypothetical protein WBM08_00395 [Prochlorococcaceae cyanobacterium]